jgi:hypothetical protein
MARNKTRVPSQAQDTPYHLVTQAVACSKQAHIKAQVEILRTKKTAHTCKATVWRWHLGAGMFKTSAKWMQANCWHVCLLFCGMWAPATDCLQWTVIGRYQGPLNMDTSCHTSLWFLCPSSQSNTTLSRRRGHRHMPHT